MIRFTFCNTCIRQGVHSSSNFRPSVCQQFTQNVFSADLIAVSAEPRPYVIIVLGILFKRALWPAGDLDLHFTFSSDIDTGNL